MYIYTYTYIIYIYIFVYIVSHFPYFFIAKFRLCPVSSILDLVMATFSCAFEW